MNIDMSGKPNLASIHQHVMNMAPAQQQSFLRENPSLANALAQYRHSASLSKLPKPDYWSEKFRQEGKVVDSDLLLYEQIIRRDADFDKFSSSANRDILQKLYKDLDFYSQLKVSRSKAIQLAMTGRPTESCWGEGYSGYGNGFSSGPTKLVMPSARKRHSKVPDQYYSELDVHAQARVPECLVPIRLDFDVERDKFKLNETFLWNLNEKLVSLERFVAIMMEDYHFSNPVFSSCVLSSIREQIKEFQIARNARSEVRILIKIDVAAANNHLVDQFEWDLCNQENDPEEFAQVMCQELSLPGEFVTAVSHSIREQVQLYTKALTAVGYKFDGSAIEEEDIRRHILSPLKRDGADVFREKHLLPEFSPQMAEISHGDLERLDKDKERDSRRKRRGQGRVGRRGGVVLPDLADTPKVIRTPIPSSVAPTGVDIGPHAEGFIETFEGVETPSQQAQRRQHQLLNSRVQVRRDINRFFVKILL